MKDTVQIRSTITSQLLKDSLIHGMALAIPGTVLLVWSGIWLPATSLGVWGFAIFVVGLWLITRGLAPYRKLLQLQAHPHLIIMDDEALHFLKKGQATLSIPRLSIDSINFQDDLASYGIAVRLAKKSGKKIVVQDSKLNGDAFLQDSRERFNCDLFLPYFSKRSFEKIK
jgi:hypothetical protein